MTGLSGVTGRAGESVVVVGVGMQNVCYSEKQMTKMYLTLASSQLVFLFFFLLRSTT